MIYNKYLLYFMTEQNYNLFVIINNLKFLYEKLCNTTV